jgi:hypothetical protein
MNEIKMAHNLLKNILVNKMSKRNMGDPKVSIFSVE